MLLEEGEDYVPTQDVLEVPADAMNALERLHQKGEERAKKIREKNLEKRLAPPRKPVSPKPVEDSAGVSGKRSRDDDGDEEVTSKSKKSKDGDSQSNPADLLSADKEKDEGDLAAQQTELQEDEDLWF